MLAGPPTQLILASDMECERITVTNGSEAQSRLLLSGAALQLVDEHGNASPAAGQTVRISLRWPADTEGMLAYKLSSASLSSIVPCTASAVTS